MGSIASSYNNIKMRQTLVHTRVFECSCLLIVTVNRLDSLAAFNRELRVSTRTRVILRRERAINVRLAYSGGHLSFTAEKDSKRV